MRVLVVNAYDRHNAGDASLLSAALEQVESAFPSAQVCFTSLEHPGTHRSFGAARNLGSIRRWAGDEAIGRPARVARKAAAFALLLAPGPVLRLADACRTGRPGHEPIGEVAELARADLVVGLGGGYLNGAPGLAGTLNITFLVLPLLLAHRLKRPVVLAPQSYGPYANPVQTWLVRRALNQVPSIVVREDQSMQRLIDIGIDRHRLSRGIDSAFASRPTARPRAEERARPRVGVTARTWLRGSAGQRYEAALAEFIDWLQTERDAEVTLIPQVTSTYQGDDDRTISHRIADRCTQQPRVITGQIPHDELRALYADLDVIVGTRFHSVIFALTAGVPAIAIEYEHKTSGIMTDLGLAAWVIPIAEVSADCLWERFVALEHDRGTYLAQLAASLPDYQRRAAEFVGVLRAAAA